MLSAANPMGRVMMTLLVFEAITIGLAIPVMITVSDTSPLAAALAGGGAGLLAVVAAGTLRRPRIGYPLGWAAQAAALALGLLTFGMVLIGIMFMCLWVVSFVLGRRLELQRSASR